MVLSANAVGLSESLKNMYTTTYTSDSNAICLADDDKN